MATLPRGRTGPSHWPRTVSLTLLVRPRPFSSSSGREAGKSHIGAKPIPLPPGVSLFLNPTSHYKPTQHALKAGTKGAIELVVKGPLGQIGVDVAPFVKFGIARPQGPMVEGQQRETVQMLNPAGHVSEITGTPWQMPAYTSTSTPPTTLIPIPLKGQDDVVQIEVDDAQSKLQRGTWGNIRTLIANAVEGVTKGWTYTVRLVGVTYRAELEDAPRSFVPSTSRLNSSDHRPTYTTRQHVKTHSPPRTGPSAPPSETAFVSPKRLNLKLGFSHPVIINLPTTPTFLGAEVPAPTQIVLKGVDKMEVGELAASIRRWRKPEPYSASFALLLRCVSKGATLMHKMDTQTEKVSTSTTNRSDAKRSRSARTGSPSVGGHYLVLSSVRSRWSCHHAQLQSIAYPPSPSSPDCTSSEVPSPAKLELLRERLSEKGLGSRFSTRRECPLLLLRCPPLGRDNPRFLSAPKRVPIDQRARRSRVPRGWQLARSSGPSCLRSPSTGSLLTLCSDSDSDSDSKH